SSDLLKVPGFLGAFFSCAAYTTAGKNLLFRASWRDFIASGGGARSRQQVSLAPGCTTEPGMIKDAGNGLGVAEGASAHHDIKLAQRKLSGSNSFVGFGAGLAGRQALG